MKTLLCISPHFPPVNSADMHRLRQSLAYFEDYGWKPVVFMVKPDYIEEEQESLLLESIPKNIEINTVSAFSTSWTRKIGLGNLGIRSWLQYYYAVTAYIKTNKIDLIYFTTTVFTIMSLGPIWKKKFNIPFVIDLQDPWRNDYYLSLPKQKRPRKFWFDYLQKKYLEAYTMPKVDGVVAVSKAYINQIKSRYTTLKSLECLTIPFGAMKTDMEIAARVNPIPMNKDFINIVYVGRGGSDMEFALSAIFCAFKKGLTTNQGLFKNIRFHFFGTSYAASGQGIKNVLPIASKYDVEDYVFEDSDRLPYFQSLSTLKQADVLFIPGSIDEKYTASKVFPYILAEKPIVAIFNEKSSVVDILKTQPGREVVEFRSDMTINDVSNKVLNQLIEILRKLPFEPKIDKSNLQPYLASTMTQKQCLYFDQILQKSQSLNDIFH